MKEIKHNSLCETETFETISDNDIKKALECCGNQIACTDGCPLDDLGGIDKCIHTLLLNALDLINRQQAVINEKDEIIKAQADCIFTLERALENKTTEFKSYKSLYDDLKAENLETIKVIKNVKTEAIKEFCKKRGIEYVENDV